MRWATVCVAPCDATMTEGLEYRIGGPGVQRSSVFVVPSGEGPLQLRADVGAKGPFVTGIVVMAVGGATLGLGFIMLYSGNDQTTALATVAAGGTATLVGLGLLLSNRTELLLVDGRRAKSGLLPSGLKLTPSGLVF
jgi:hypothetical protein